MTDEPSPWPEQRRTQYALFGAGGLLLAVVAVALVAPGAVPLGEAHVVGVATVASALLLYGLLGAAGDIVEEQDEAGDEHPSTDGDTAADDPDDGQGDVADDGEVVDADPSDEAVDARDGDR